MNPGLYMEKSFFLTMSKSYYFDKDIKGNLLSETPIVIIEKAFLVIELFITGIKIDFRLEPHDSDSKRPPKRIVEGYMNARIKSYFATPEMLRMSITMNMHHPGGSLVSFPKPQPLFFVPANTSDSTKLIFKDDRYATDEIGGISLTDLRYY